MVVRKVRPGQITGLIRGNGDEGKLDTGSEGGEVTFNNPTVQIAHDEPQAPVTKIMKHIFKHLSSHASDRRSFQRLLLTFNLFPIYRLSTGHLHQLSFYLTITITIIVNLTHNDDILMASTVDQPPLAPPVKYTVQFGTRWQNEKAAAGHGTLEFPQDPRYIGQWIIGECVGKGANGRVRIAKHRRTGQLAAVKIIPLHPVTSSRASIATQQARLEKKRFGVDREIIMMKLMNHPNIIRIYDVFEGERELYLVLEYVEGGELFDLLFNCGRLPPLEALSFFKQIVYGLNYAHSFSIIHRDLKPENILIHSLNPPFIKIADWGMAAFAPPALHLETFCGSPHYASPEIVNGLKYKGSASDIWSCGVILFALLAGRLPFDDKNLDTLLSKVKAGKYTVPDYFDPEAKDLLTRMLAVDVNSRITVSSSSVMFLRLVNAYRFLR